MKKFFSILISWAIIGSVVLLAGGIIYRGRFEASHYFDVLGVEELSVQKMAELINEKDKTDVIEDGSDIIIKCQGFEIIATKPNKDIYLFKRIEIYDNMYKFTWRNIGVGSTKKEVEKAYIKNKPIKDLQQNQKGYIVDNLWIKFQFTEDETVEKITLFYGP